MATSFVGGAKSCLLPALLLLGVVGVVVGVFEFTRFALPGDI